MKGVVGTASGLHEMRNSRGTPSSPTGVDASDGERLIVKLREFREGLDPAERELLAALLAPGIAQALASDPSGDDVTGYSQSPFAPLAQALVEAVRESGLRVVGFTSSE
jgi:hypothetical protein